MIPDTVLDLGGDSDEDDRTTVSLPLVPIPELPLQPPLIQAVPVVPAIPAPPPVIPAVPPVVHAPSRRTMRVSHPPGEWWKVKHPAEPEAEAPVIWSDNEEENPGDGQQVNSGSGQEPCTFKEVMQGSQSDRWRDAALLVQHSGGEWHLGDC